MKVMIVVTHLLGTGHLARASVLARAFKAQGHGVTLVSGGRPVRHIDTSDIHFVQLPALASDGVDFSTLLDVNGTPASDALMQQRRDTLCATLHQVQPDALITELFPFGRRNLADEFTQLLDAAHAMANRPAIFSSIRDVLASPSKPSKAAQTEHRISTYYDAVLVHSDADLIPLNLSWPVTPALAGRLEYTGFVAPDAAPALKTELGAGEIIVSAGGGDVGLPVFTAALDAARHDTTQKWRVLVGGSQAAQTCADLERHASENVIVEPARPDFRSMLHYAKASVSMCGYNTAMDVLQAGVPAVWVPFDAGGEVEQGMRARALAHMPGMDMIETRALTGATLNAAIARVLTAPRRSVDASVFLGARETVRIVARHLKEAA